MFVHIVLFWFNEDAPTDAVLSMKNDCDELLKKIKGIEHLWYGKPAMIPREVVDNSYNFGLCVIFQDRRTHDEYQNDPLHEEFRKRNKSGWKKVLVYDF